MRPPLAPVEARPREGAFACTRAGDVDTELHKEHLAVAGQLERPIAVVEHVSRDQRFRHPNPKPPGQVVVTRPRLS